MVAFSSLEDQLLAGRYCTCVNTDIRIFASGPSLKAYVLDVASFSKHLVRL